MGVLQCTRAADRPDDKGSTGVKPDVSQVLGTWINTNASGSVVKFVLAEDQDSLLVRAFGAASPAPIDWGQVKALATFATDVNSGRVTAFTASYDFGFMQIELQGNTNLGLFVLAGFNTFKDGSGRSNYFSREFFYRSEAEPDTAQRPQAWDADGMQYVKIADRVESRAEKPDGASVDVTPLVGQWVTTNTASKGIGKIIITEEGGAPVVNAFGAWPGELWDWGKVKGRLFADNGINSMLGRAVSVVYDFGFSEAHLQIKIKKGTLVVAGFNRFKDGTDRSNYFSREFYYRA